MEGLNARLMVCSGSNSNICLVFVSGYYSGMACVPMSTSTCQSCTASARGLEKIRWVTVPPSSVSLKSSTLHARSYCTAGACLMAILRPFYLLELSKSRRRLLWLEFCDEWTVGSWEHLHLHLFVSFSILSATSQSLTT